MSDNQVYLVKNSWDLVASELEDFCAVFAKQLSRLKPELKPLLKKLSDERRLFETILTINQLVNSLSDFKDAEKNVFLLVAGYSDLSFTREDYDTALIAFLMALEKKMGRKWNNETRDAWIFTLVTIYQHFARKLERPITLLRPPVQADRAA